MNSHDIRSDTDLSMSEIIVNDPLVKKVKLQIERTEEKGPLGIRRHLLSTSVRLSPTMSPGLHKMADHCIEKLGVQVPLELYAYSSPTFNAACFKPEEGRLFVMFSSSLLESFEDEELMFVMGHEFGHHVYQHHEVPVGYLLKGPQRPPANLALQLYTWSRYAEISADRAGAYCAGNLDAVARALFKLSSGLVSNRVVNFDLTEFLRQLDEMQAVDAAPGEGAPMQDWFSTHPFSPLRVKALQLFHASELMRTGGSSKAELEMGVQGIMGLMEPNYLQGQTDTAKSMRLLFIGASVAVANARDGISEGERAVLKKFIGNDFSIDVLDMDKLFDTLPKRIEVVVSKTNITQRMQVMRDLVVVARVEGNLSDNERIVLLDIAGRLQVPHNLVAQFLSESADLD